MDTSEEISNIEFMISLYCRKKHGDNMCSSCRELFEYAKTRINNCIHKATKSFCSVCNTPCYKNNMREEIRRVMKFSGPRMLLYKPKTALRHMAITIKAKRGNS